MESSQPPRLTFEHYSISSTSETETTPLRPHRQTCAKCNNCGQVPSKVLNLLQSYPYRAEKDRNLVRLIRSVIDSLRDPAGSHFFTASKHYRLPLSFNGKQQCLVLPSLIVHDVSSKTPLVAFTHDSGRCDAFNDLFPRSAGITEAKVKSAAEAAINSEINPHDVGVLIAMAQEAQRVHLDSKSQDQIPVLFTPTLLTPTPDRHAMYVYRASISSDYLESFIDIHKPLDSEMRILRAKLAFDDTSNLLETLGQILDIHQRLAGVGKPVVTIGKATWTQKRGVDAEEDRYPTKRQRHHKSPLSDIVSSNLIQDVKVYYMP